MALSDYYSEENGVERCGCREVWLEILEAYKDEMEENRVQMLQYFEAGDIKNFTVTVHSLKSSSRIVGADALADYAMRLEEYGKAEQADKIKEELDGLSEMCIEYRKALDEL